MSFEIYGPDPTVLDTSGRKPHVLIIGAGLAGLTLAILLQNADIPYDLFEKSSENEAVCSALFLGPQVGPIFTQLGIMDEYLDQSKPCSSIQLFDQDRQPDFQLNFQLYHEIGGYAGRIIPHKTMHSILISRIPPERLHKGKRMLWMTQGENGVLIRFQDGKSFEGDILVGADGAHSAVRQCMYDNLKKNKKLPSSDGRDLPFSCVCLVGRTDRLEREMFPELEEDGCRFLNTRSDDKPFSWNTITCKDDRICWTATQYLDRESSTTLNSNFMTTDWGEGAAESMREDVRAFPILCGDGTLTLGDLIDRTPRHQMTKVVLEEKVFETWYYCRTILIGDACHKLHPAGGKGAMLAFQDAYSLATHLTALRTIQLKDLKPAFKAHKLARLSATQKAWTLSRTMAKVYTTEKTYVAVMTRRMVKGMPPWVWKKIFERMVTADKTNNASSSRSI
ncbi:hypothetical protein BGX23_012039 [Mortierella sp. AD031]|nr:hypothetical protein BGX23_012039 [Mortierella sp. AD031]